MEAVGNLAGGVAHDFNNLLQAMLSHTETLYAQSDDRQAVKKVAAELEHEVQRGAALTRQLLLFSRRETARTERLDLNEVVAETLKILRRVVKENIILSVEVATAPLMVQADRGQLQQILINLALNAHDAMPQGGRLLIRTGGESDETVWVAVQDTGHGIPAEIRERIFEPFFTTKPADKGTGLGLAVVHGIVTQYRGRVEVDSTVGAGSTFRVVLPRAPSAADSSEPSPSLRAAPRGRGQRILLVEDEDATRTALRDILASLGYDVVAVGSGEEAQLLPVERPFEVLVTDVMLPGIDGPELAQTLRLRWRNLKIILISGYAEDEAVRRGASKGEVRFLQKPFTMATMAKEVQAVLND
jgi:CheY-like chemotaxis protein